MTAPESQLTPNTLAFIALSNEFCNAVENASQTERDDFITAMLRLLPRIYIAASATCCALSTPCATPESTIQSTPSNPL